MTTKGPSRKQVIIPMSKVNVDNILALANEYVANINRALKNVKSSVTVDFIHLGSKTSLIKVILKDHKDPLFHGGH